MESQSRFTRGKAIISQNFRAYPACNSGSYCTGSGKARTRGTGITVFRHRYGSALSWQDFKVRYMCFLISHIESQRLVEITIEKVAVP